MSHNVGYEAVHTGSESPSHDPLDLSSSPVSVSLRRIVSRPWQKIALPWVHMTWALMRGLLGNMGMSSDLP